MPTPTAHTTTTPAHPAPGAAAPAGAARRALLTVWTLCERELVRFFRQRNRVVGAVGQPVIFWLLFGAGLGGSFRLAGAQGDASIGYREYFVPGTLVLIVLFTAIFATISLIEDRREGFLQSVLVAPISRGAMVAGKIIGGTLIAMLQGLIFLLLALTLELDVRWAALPAVIGLLLLVAVGLTALGFVIAWGMDSTQGFHAVMSVLLMPMWLLSGAFFPAPSLGPASGLVDHGVWWLMQLNPLTYGVAGLRRLLYLGTPAETALPAELPSLALSLGVTLLFVVVTLLAAWRISARRTTGDLL